MKKSHFSDLDGSFHISSLASAAYLAAHSSSAQNTDVPRSRLRHPSAMEHIRGVVRRDDTILRLGGVGDNYHMSWAADGRQFVAVCDGSGWSQHPPGLYNSRLFAIEGFPPHPSFEDIRGYPTLVPEVSMNIPRYYGFGTLSFDENIYQFLSTFNHSVYRPDGGIRPDLRFVGTKLIYSSDRGRTWRNQDGSSPVVWEPWDRQSRETLVFFEEPQDAFSLLTVLQMGRGYRANKDGYVYVYSPNGATEGTMNELVMFRVPKTRILDRPAYEYFSGRRPDGTATWHSSINSRSVVHTFPRGWVNRTTHPYAWQPSVIYNEPLNCYLMANYGIGCSAEGEWFYKPSYLGFWAAHQPWGPWVQFHKESAWTPGNDRNARAYQPQIAPKWVAENGGSFWLVWSDIQMKQHGAPLDWGKMDGTKMLAEIRRTQPFHMFNAQRYDILFS